MSLRLASLTPCALCVLTLASSTLAGCDADDITSMRFDAGQDGGEGGPDGGPMDDGGISPLLEAPEAEEVGTLELDESVTDVIYAEDLPIGLHEDGGASILDLSDPTEPAILAALPSDGRIVGVAIDVQLRLLFVVTVSGDLRVFRVSDRRNPVQLAQLTLSEPGGGQGSIQGLVRVGFRLFALGGGSLLPVRIQFGSGSSVSLLAEDPVELDADPTQLATGSNVVYVAFAGGKIQVWSATSSPALLDQGNLGADVVAMIARGRRLFVALRGQGLRVVDMSSRGTLRVLFDAPEFDDLTGLERLGNLVLVSLSRGLVIALDLSDITAPRALASRRGALPGWIAAIGGNLVLGGGSSLSVLGVPPFVAASLPAPLASSFPRYGRIPLQLSKPIDPSTVTLDNVTLRCGGAAVTGTLSVSLDHLRITFLPSQTLPAGVRCDLTIDGVLDALGLPLAMPRQGVSFTTAMAAPAPIENPASEYPHTADGAFTDWEPGMTEDFEYFDVQGAQGMYSRFYADFDGEKLWMLNDWFYNGDDIDPDCYNQFGVWTGGGSQWWEIRAYGDQRIEVRLNGELLDEDDERVSGGYAFTATPNDPKEHTVYEIAIATEPGRWGVQLHDPGPTFSCQQLETDPTTYAGMSTMGGSTIDPTEVPSMPSEPTPRVTGVGSGTPTLSWGLGQGAGAFTTFVVELSTGDDLSNVFFRTVVYGGTLVLPPGLLEPGMTYTVRLSAYNLIGSVSSEPFTFTVPGGDAPEAPSLDTLQPSTVTQGQAVSVTISGEGFVQGARAYLDGAAVSTTFENGTTLIVMLTADDLEDAGTFELTVRNVPGDESTESDALELTVTEAQSDVVTLVGLDPDTLTEGVQASITVTLTDADEGTYTLVLSPAVGGDDLSFECDHTGSNQCQASVTVSTPGEYDATIRVGSGDDAYDTNTLQDEVTVNAAGSTVTLVSLSPDTVTQSTAANVAVTMTNAGPGVYYLILTPASGGAALSPIFCDYTSQSHCTASVNLGTVGDYDAHIQVGEGGSAYDTNTVNDALTVSAAACVHDECWPGARLSSSCSACAMAVCSNEAACCTTEWSSSCVAEADSNVACGCTPPALALQETLSPNTMEQGATTAVEVQMQNEPTVAGYTFDLYLVPAGLSDGLLLGCIDYSASEHTCTAQVPDLAAGAYDAYLRVEHTTSGMTYFSAARPSAFTITEPSGGVCASGGMPLDPDGSGVCAQPWVVDLSDAAAGSSYVHTIHASSDSNEDDVTLGAMGTCLQGTGRDHVYSVTVPSTSTVLTVRAGGNGSSNTVVAFTQDNVCNDTKSVCADSSAAGTCEVAVQDGDFFAPNPYVIVSETTPSGGAIEVRFEID